MKKINELNEPAKARPTIEDQIAFVEELSRRSKERQQILREMLIELKAEPGITGEID